MFLPPDNYEHDLARRPIYVGGNCFNRAGMPNAGAEAIHKTVAVIAGGQAPAEGYYAANSFIAQRSRGDELIAQVAADLDGLAPLVAESK